MSPTAMSSMPLVVGVKGTDHPAPSQLAMPGTVSMPPFTELKGPLTSSLGPLPESKVAMAQTAEATPPPTSLQAAPSQRARLSWGKPGSAFQKPPT